MKEERAGGVGGDDIFSFCFFSSSQSTITLACTLEVDPSLQGGSGENEGILPEDREEGTDDALHRDEAVNTLCKEGFTVPVHFEEVSQ